MVIEFLSRCLPSALVYHILSYAPRFVIPKPRPPILPGYWWKEDFDHCTRIGGRLYHVMYSKFITVFDHTWYMAGYELDERRRIIYPLRKLMVSSDGRTLRTAEGLYRYHKSRNALA